MALSTEQIRDALVMTEEKYLLEIARFAELCIIHKIFSKPKAKFSKMEWVEKE